MKYLKWVFGNKVSNMENEQFEIGKTITADMWDPYNEDWNKRGGFNFTNEKCALRWMSRGDTLYEVEIPDDGELIEINNYKTPGGIFISNKIILKNPISISEELLIDFYKKSDLPINTYFECIGLLSSRGYYDLSLMIINDKINLNNIDQALLEFNNSIKPWHEVNYNCYNKVKEVLEEIKSDIYINLFIDKEPYIKKITNDNIINLTGQSGSGKSTYAKEQFNDDNYLIIDTDDIFSENRFKNSTGINRQLGEFFRDKYDILPNCSDNFDIIYNDILEYCKDTDKTIVIDCAQFHCIKDIKLLKGKIIVIRTCINTCYNRTIERYKKQNKNASNEEIRNYSNRKKNVFSWYKGSNNFIKKIDSTFLLKESRYVE